MEKSGALRAFSCRIATDRLGLNDGERQILSRSQSGRPAPLNVLAHAATQSHREHPPIALRQPVHTRGGRLWFAPWAPSGSVCAGFPGVLPGPRAPARLSRLVAAALLPFCKLRSERDACVLVWRPDCAIPARRLPVRDGLHEAGRNPPLSWLPGGVRPRAGRRLWHGRIRDLFDLEPWLVSGIPPCATCMPPW